MKAIKFILLIGFIFTQFAQIQMAQADIFRNLFGGTSLDHKLLEAARWGTSTEVKSLLQKGADVDAKSYGGRTALHRAAYKGDTKSVEILAVEYGADMEAKNNGGETPADVARRMGNYEVVELLEHRQQLNAKYQKINQQAEAIQKKETALHKAANRGFFSKVKSLIDSGMDINAKDGYGDTAFHDAAGNGRFKIVELFVEHGIKIDIKNNAGETALLWAASSGYINDGGDYNKFGAKVFNSVFNAFLGIRLSLGLDPLSWAVRKSDFEEDYFKVIELLVAKGADVNVKNRGSNTVLHLSTNWGKSKVNKLLIDAGADINATNKNGDTPTHWAARVGNVEMVKLFLLQEGIKIDIKNKNGETPILLAAFWGHPEVVEILVAEGVDLSTKDKDGNTALHNAARNGDFPEVMQPLLDAGADVFAKNKNGETPADLARLRKNPEVLNLLEQQQQLNAKKQKAAQRKETALKKKETAQQEKKCAKIFSK